MATWVMGIDPGINGAFALIDPAGMPAYVARPQTIKVVVNNKTRQRLNLPMTVEMFKTALQLVQEKGDRLVAYMEEVSSMPRDGGVQAFAFGRGFGQLEGILSALAIPYNLVRPQEWKAYMVAKRVMMPKVSKDVNAKITKKQKGRISRDLVKARKFASVDAANKLFPQFAETFSKPLGDGAAEAMLISEWGRRKETSFEMKKPPQEKVIIPMPPDVAVPGTAHVE